MSRSCNACASRIGSREGGLQQEALAVGDFVSSSGMMEIMHLSADPLGGGGGGVGRATDI